jgi:hypothetical protein
LVVPDYVPVQVKDAHCEETILTVYATERLASQEVPIPGLLIGEAAREGPANKADALRPDRSLESCACQRGPACPPSFTDTRWARSPTGSSR